MRSGEKKGIQPLPHRDLCRTPMKLNRLRARSLPLSDVHRRRVTDDVVGGGVRRMIVD